MPAYRLFGFYRFLLAFMVLVSHSWSLRFGTAYPFVQQIGIGNVAVMGFFILSGYVISEAVDRFYPGRPGAFIANRCVRLVPPYWAAVALSAAIHLLLIRFGTLRLIDYDVPPVARIQSWDNALIQLTAIIPVANFNQWLGNADWYYFVRYLWAIFVEFVFYGAMALAMLAWPLARRWFTLRAFAGLCALGALAIHGVSEYVRPLHSSFAFVPYFVFGASLYAWQDRRDRAALAVAVLAFLALMLHFSRYTQGTVPLSAAWAGRLGEPPVLVPILIMLTCALVVIPLARIEVSSRLARADRAIGDLSYPLYINHYVVTIAVFSLLPVGGVAQGAAIALSLAVSFAMMRLVEQPTAGLRARIRGRSVTR